MAENAALHEQARRLTLTDKEREAVEFAVECLRDAPHTAMYQTSSAAISTLRSMLARLK
jgi:hypothetical protein